MKKITESSGNELSELSDLIYTIDNLVHKDFLHVTDFVSNKFLTALRQEKERIDKEFDYRQNQLDNE